jgi:RNA polymerase sigma-70 factor (ECF subfamily)
MAAVSPLGRASGVEPRSAPADALTGLYERHASRIFQYCLNWLRSREEAEDAAQTTFLYAYRGLDRGVVPVHERPWLLSIARNVCLSRTDAARRRAVEVAQDPHAIEETVAAPAPSGELDGLTDALAKLTEQQRHAILLREWHGLTYSEIAERLELSQAAVETLLFRARRSLARRLRQPLGIGSFLPWLRSLVGGGAAKVAVGAVVVAVTATTGAIAVAHQHQSRHTTRTPAARTQQVAPEVALFAKQHVVISKTTSRPSTIVRSGDNAQQPVITPTQAQPDSTAAPAAAPNSTVEPTVAAPTITSTATTTTRAAAGTVVNTATTAAAAVTNTVVDTATTAAAPVTNVVSSVVSKTADTVAGTAATATTTAQNIIAAVTSVVPAITAPSIP